MKQVVKERHHIVVIMVRNNEYSGELRDMATEEKKKQIQYELYIPAQFDEVCRESLEILMEHKVHGVGDVSPGKTL